jgi:hypothetical protein
MLDIDLSLFNRFKKTFLARGNEATGIAVNINSRSSFANLIFSNNFESVLEIGPLDRPLLRGENIKYFDVLPTNLLREKASREGLHGESVPDIDYWDSRGNLKVINRNFSAVVSAHCIEHQPDLIQHLKDVESLVEEESLYFLVLPDYRYCFDHFISPSKLIEIIRAHNERRTIPDIYSVLEHRALTCHNEPRRHWNEDHGPAIDNLKARWEGAKTEFLAAGGNYIDVHCWQFSPETFKLQIDSLFVLGYTKWQLVEMYETPMNDLEFFCILKKASHSNP